MNKMVTLGLLLTAAALLTGCQKKETAPAAVKPAPAADKSAMGNMVTLSELQKGEVIRGKDFSAAESLQTAKSAGESLGNTAKPKTAPVLSYSDVAQCDSGSCRVGDLQEARSSSESLKGMLRKFPLMNHGTAAKNSEPDVFEEQRLLAGEAGNYNEIKLPSSFDSSKKAEKGSSDNKLPGSGHSKLPEKKSKNGLWPGGVPLEAEIDPAITGF